MSQLNRGFWEKIIDNHGVIWEKKWICIPPGNKLQMSKFTLYELILGQHTHQTKEDAPPSQRLCVLLDTASYRLYSIISKNDESQETFQAFS